MVVAEVAVGEEPVALGERLRRAVERTVFDTDAGELSVTISVGVAVAAPAGRRLRMSLSGVQTSRCMKRRRVAATVW